MQTAWEMNERHAAIEFQDKPVKVVDTVVRQGKFLFRWRGYLPILLLVPAWLAIRERALLDQADTGSVNDWWAAAGFVISLAGLAIRWITIGSAPSGTSGRNTGSQKARQLNTLGMYSVARNPLYLGNGLAILGVLVAIKVWWFVLVGCLAYWLYIERIIAAEETFLAEQFGEEYANWVDRTPIFWPKLSLWQKPTLSFSVRTVLKREYNGLMALCTVFLILEFVGDVVIGKMPFRIWLREDWQWLIVFAAATAIFVTLRTLKRKTRLLHVPGR